eukprot:535042_1
MNKVEKTRNSHRKNRQKQKTGKIIRKTQTQKSKNYQIRQDTLRHTSNQDKLRTNQENTKLQPSHFKHGTANRNQAKQEREEILKHHQVKSQSRRNKDKKSKMINISEYYIANGIIRIRLTSLPNYKYKNGIIVILTIGFPKRYFNHHYGTILKTETNVFYNEINVQIKYSRWIHSINMDNT